MDNNDLTQPQTATPWVPEHADIEGLRKAAADCKGCELWQPATQVVFSAGNPRAPLALVGEQPGDVEDREGIPFVGPAGRLLQDALEEAGVTREDVYVTNAVKHFRFTERGQVLELATPVGIRPVLATVHPSAVLRTTAEERSEAFAGLVADLRTAREAAISDKR